MPALDQSLVKVRFLKRHESIAAIVLMKGDVVHLERWYANQLVALGEIELIDERAWLTHPSGVQS